ncbi:hypothetical protein RUMOBE_01826 [Blautia obeum ATCC 29174]|uniref:Uncharacterized protein n=1 Tax=Blautia obeum ATCC 29174 TaxID=411459 RepID=A5ZS49_9FIRM|nr:hypothetical protein RUMOBE_01826 [Blautia obeum ATCC 29174]
MLEEFKFLYIIPYTGIHVFYDFRTQICINADAVFFAVVNHNSPDPGIIAGKVFVKMPEILWFCHPQKAIKFQ